MTTAEALAIAAAAKPLLRAKLHKMHEDGGALGGMRDEMQKQLDVARAGLTLVADHLNVNITGNMQ